MASRTPALDRLRRDNGLGDLASSRRIFLIGFVDAFCEGRDWFAETYLAIDQGPIIVMIENQRTGLPWKLFMSAPEVRTGLRRLGFTSPWLERAPTG